MYCALTWLSVCQRAQWKGAAAGFFFKTHFFCHARKKGVQVKEGCFKCVFDSRASLQTASERKEGMRSGLGDTLACVLPDIPSDLVSRAGERGRQLGRLHY